MIKVFLCVLCVLCGLRSSASALDRDAFTFTKYELDVRIEPGQQRLAVRGTITLRNDSAAPQKDASLQISSSLDWRSIRIQGKPVQFVSQPYTSDIDHTGALSEAIVSLPQPVPPHGTVDVEVGYEGTIPLDTTRLTRIGVPADIAKHSDWDRIGKNFSAVRGIGYVAWYPIATEAVSLSEGNSVFREIGRWKAREAAATARDRVCVESTGGDGLRFPFVNVPVAGVNAGSAQGATNGTGDACRVYESSGSADIVPTIVVGSYEVLENSMGGIHYFAQHLSQAETYATAVNTTKPFVTGWFGAPTGAMDLFEQEDPEAAPFENGDLLLLPLDNVDSKLAEMTAVHQLTHASFPSPREWIYEGLAHFAQALYEEHQSGREAALKSMALQLPSVFRTEKALTKQMEEGGKDKDANPARRDSLINTPLEELYRSKAMYVWWMLRDMLGDTALKHALAAYHADADREPAYMQHLLETASHRDLEWFFDDWVYRDRGLPDFKVESVYPRKLLPKGYMVTVTVENVGEAGAEVPVTVKTESGDLSKRLEVHGKTKASIRIETEAPPQEVILNDGSVPESDLGNNTFTAPAPAQ